MTAALLEAHGMRTGAYLSPHTERWSERVRIGGEEIDAGEFAAAVERVAQSVEVVNRALDEGESVTQFEAATAAAFVALAAAGVEVGVIEAGLGGRLDATNVIPSRVDGADLGRPRAHRVAGRDRGGDRGREARRAARPLDAGRWAESATGCEQLAERTAAERSARLIVAGELRPGFRLAVPGAYQRRNFAVALAAAEAILGGLDPDRVRGWPRGSSCRGGCEVLDGRPAAGPRRRPQPGRRPRARRGAARGGRRGAGRRLPRGPGGQGRGRDRRGAGAGLDVAVCTELPAERLARPGARRRARWRRRARRAAPRRPGSARGGGRRAGGGAASRRWRLARERGGVALVTGSHYLLGDAWTERHAQSSSR